MRTLLPAAVANPPIRRSRLRPAGGPHPLPRRAPARAVRRARALAPLPAACACLPLARSLVADAGPRTACSALGSPADPPDITIRAGLYPPPVVASCRSALASALPHQAIVSRLPCLKPPSASPLAITPAPSARRFTAACLGCMCRASSLAAIYRGAPPVSFAVPTWAVHLLPPCNASVTTQAKRLGAFRQLPTEVRPAWPRVRRGRRRSWAGIPEGQALVGPSCRSLAFALHYRSNATTCKHRGEAGPPLVPVALPRPPEADPAAMPPRLDPSLRSSFA